VFGPDFIAIDGPSAKFAVERVEVETVPPWNQRERLFRVGPQFVGGSSPAGIIARGSQPAAKSRRSRLESRDIVALPAMQRYRHAAQVFESSRNIHAERGIPFNGERVGGFDGRCSHGDLVAACGRASA
jgi:hypothetical protein